MWPFKNQIPLNGSGIYTPFTVIIENAQRAHSPQRLDLSSSKSLAAVLASEFQIGKNSLHTEDSLQLVAGFFKIIETYILPTICRL
jgi:hypothetical protein